jgi:hypothetical protein
MISLSSSILLKPHVILNYEFADLQQGFIIGFISVLMIGNGFMSFIF